MENFVYHHPVKIIFGRGVLDQLGRELSSLGSRILLVYGQESIKKSGLYNTITTILEQAGIEYADFGGVQPNPLLSTARKGVEIARDSASTVILAVGGGSVIDVAKAISAGVLVEHDVWQFFAGRKTVRKALPLVTIPTVAGSGSEVNHGLVLTHDEKKLKFGFAHRHLYPRVCIADPSLTFSVDEAQTSYGCVDALCHCLEPFLTSQTKGIELQLRFLSSVATSLIEAAQGCLAEPRSESHRATMLWSSMMAMTPLATAGLGRVYHPLHILEHGLSAIYKIPHGAGLAALMKGWLSEYLEEFRTPISRWGEQVFGVTATPNDVQSETTIQALHHLLLALNCPTRLSDLGLKEKDLVLVAAHAAAQLRVRSIPGLDERRALTILKSSL